VCVCAVGGSLSFSFSLHLPTKRPATAPRAVISSGHRSAITIATNTGVGVGSRHATNAALASAWPFAIDIRHPVGAVCYYGKDHLQLLDYRHFDEYITSRDPLAIVSAASRSPCACQCFVYLDRRNLLCKLKRQQGAVGACSFWVGFLVSSNVVASEWLRKGTSGILILTRLNWNA